MWCLKIKEGGGIMWNRSPIIILFKNRKGFLMQPTNIHYTEIQLHPSFVLFLLLR